MSRQITLTQTDVDLRDFPQEVSRLLAAVKTSGATTITVTIEGASFRGMPIPEDLGPVMGLDGKVQRPLKQGA